jgi:hypothetical protein
MGFQLSQRGPGSARWRKQPNPERAAKARDLFGNRGLSGRTGERLAELTPKATNLPALMCCSTEGALANAIGT